MKKKITYDRNAVGKRLQCRRKQLSWSRRYVAERVGLVEKYYADIERGSCGMSIETLIALTDLYGFTLDSLIYGDRGQLGIFWQDKTLLKKLEAMLPQQQDACLQILTLFVNGIHAGETDDNAASSIGVTESVLL